MGEGQARPGVFFQRKGAKCAKAAKGIFETFVPEGVGNREGL